MNVMHRRAISHVLTSALACSTIVLPRPAFAGSPDAGDAYAAAIERAEQAEARQAWADAIAAYRAAYGALSPPDRAGALGGYIVDLVLARVRREDGALRDPDALRGAIDLLDLHGADLAANAPGRDASKYIGAREELAAKLESVSPAPADRGATTEGAVTEDDAATVPEPDAPIEASGSTEAERPPFPTVEAPSPEPTIADGGRSDGKRGPRALPPALVATGAIATAAGIALVGYGVWFRGDVDDEFERVSPPCDGRWSHPQCTRLNGWRDDELAKSIGLLAGGAAIAAVGVGTLATGIALLVRKRRGRESIAVQSHAWPGMAGLTVRGRF